MDIKRHPLIARFSYRVRVRVGHRSWWGVNRSQGNQRRDICVWNRFEHRRMAIIRWGVGCWFIIC